MTLEPDGALKRVPMRVVNGLVFGADSVPGLYNRAPEVGSVKGKAPRRPPLSWQARDTLLRIGKHLDEIDRELLFLSEPGLRGLAFEAERTTATEHEALWRGVAGHARRQRAILVAHRSGRGAWYAVVTSFRREQGRERVIDVADAKAKTQAEAIAAGARLMTGKAHWLGPEVRLTIAIVSALEWRAVEV